MREKKYIEFYKDVGSPKDNQRYVKNVKYRIVDETEDNYIISRKKNAFSKSDEGELYTTGKI